MPHKSAAPAGRNVNRRLQVVYRRIDDLKLDPRNPREHSRNQIRQLARSIEVFGFTAPALVDAESNVIAGHGRIMACRELGWSEIPTIPIEGLSKAERRALQLADNRLAENGQWNERLLAEQLKELSLELDCIEITGFEVAEVDLRINGLEGECQADDPADVAPELALGPTTTRLGDLWHLDGHRLLCGNVLDTVALETLMGEERASMVFCDPPFNVRIDGHATGLGRVRHREFPMAAGEMSQPAFAIFLERAMRNQAAFCVDGAVAYVCIDWRHLAELLTAGRAIDATMLNLCVWIKDNGGMGSFYRSQHELVLVFKIGNSRYRNNIQLGRFGRNRSNVWHYPGMNSFARNTKEGNLLSVHPTVKPVSLVRDTILDCTSPGDIVVDGFSGVGSTIIAAHRVGRRCYGIELDPAYVDATIRRWERLTGGTAHHAESGLSFGQLAQNVGASDVE